MLHLNTMLKPVYAGKVEECSSDGIQFLDLWLSFVHINATEKVIQFSPSCKVKGPQLNLISAHPLNIHMQWPLAYLRTLYQHSSRIKDFNVVKKQFFDRLRSVFVPSHFITHLDSLTAYYTPQAVGNNKKKKPDSHDVLRIIFEYHPLWEHVFCKYVHEFGNNGYHSSLLAAVFGEGVHFELRSCWSLKTSKPFGSALIEW